MRSDYVWRYLAGRNMAHALRVQSNVLGHATYAACGTAPGWLGFDGERWRGGDGIEAERAAMMVRCRRCAAIMARPEVKP
jgi:hypothetical protein